MRALLLVVAVASAASAQPVKPVGAFSPEGAPSWVSFGGLPDWATDAEVGAAVTRCGSGFRWILQMGYALDPHEPVRDHAVGVKARMDRLGLSPCIVATTVGEEWYERFQHGHFAAYGLPRPVTDAEWTAGVGLIHAWRGMQHADVRAVTGWPVIWLTNVANNDPVFGARWWRPVPAFTDYVAIDAYVWRGQTFDADVLPILRHAERTIPQPLVMIPQWVAMPGFEAPEPARYAEVFLGSPRWVASWGFLWASRPWQGLVGLADLPGERLALERALGVW